jgi:hypothetical protein
MMRITNPSYTKSQSDVDENSSCNLTFSLFVSHEFGTTDADGSYPQYLRAEIKSYTNRWVVRRSG